MLPETEPQASPGTDLDPVRKDERVGSVDILRGVALLGILVMNIYAFALPFPAYTNPFLGGMEGPADWTTWWATHLLAEMKFMTIFSMLFGAGLALMAERAEARGTDFGKLYYKRLAWLALFGVLHAYLLWFGDILYWYAVCGLILYPLRRLSPKFLLPLGVALLLVTVPITLGFGFLGIPFFKGQALEAEEAQAAGEELTEEQETAIETWKQFHPGEEVLQEEIDAYRGGYLGQIAQRAPLVIQFQTVFIIFFGIWRIGGTMIIGIGLMKLGMFSARWSSGAYLALCVAGYGAGVPLVYFGGRALVDREFDVLYMNQVGMFPNYFGSFLVAFGHVGLVMLLCKSGVLSWLTRRLAAVGRMALTNYLAHTLICTTLFYGWGFGLFGRLSRAEMMAIVPLIWLFQLIVSPIWLARFRFGPAEWLWRSLTYGQRQPMRVQPPTRRML